MRVAICSVGLVSPRSTCESIGALTPQRSARSRSERPIASRSARTRAPIAATEVASTSLMYVRTLSRTVVSVRPPAPTIGRDAPTRRARARAPAARSAPPGSAACSQASPRRAGSTSPPASSIVGTSAGSMVGADLLVGEEPRAPRRRRDRRAPIGDDAAEERALIAEPSRRRTATAARTTRQPTRRRRRERGRRARSPRSRSRSAARRGALVRAAALARIERAAACARRPRRERIAGTGLRFDGRLRVGCVERASGRRVVFGAPGAPARPSPRRCRRRAACRGRYRRCASARPRVRRRRRVEPDEHRRGAGAARDARAVPRADGRPARPPRAPPRGARRDGRPRSALETLALRRRGANVAVVAPDAGRPAEQRAPPASARDARSQACSRPPRASRCATLARPRR